MERVLLVAFLLLSSWTFVNGSLFNFRYKNYISKLMNKNRAVTVSRLLLTEEKNVSQPLDHFDVLVKGSIKQRYYVVSDYWKKPNGPVFLYIGGEGTLASFQTDGLLISEIAETQGALLVSAEHRYYGESLNKDSLELNNLQHLSSEQALADLANLHQVISQEYSLGPKNTWICFGGSYAGNLAAWFRIKYPHLVHAAVASSAPVRAITNFEDYNNVVRSSLSDPTVGGSLQCVNNISSAFKEIERCLQNKSLDRLQKDFKLCTPLKSKNDYATFLSQLTDPIEGSVQYNTKGVEFSIENICKNITVTEGSPYAKIVNMNKEFLQSIGEDCLASSYLATLGDINDTTVKTDPGSGMRSWIYQTCSQFGFFQTCDVNTNCPFSSYLSLSLYLDICRDVFGITEDQINARVNFTNQYYGSDKPTGTRILFVNGIIDPWHSLSVLKNISISESALYIRGASHCADMDGSSQDDTPELAEAKKNIKQQVANWLTDGYDA